MENGVGYSEYLSTMQYLVGLIEDNIQFNRTSVVIITVLTLSMLNTTTPTDS
jgi:hypothetical protein